MIKNEDIFLDRLPKIDLHGYDREIARIMTNDFIEEAVMLGYREILIIHGIGSGVVKTAVHEALGKNKWVLGYKLDNINMGCTIVELKEDDKK